MIKIIYSGGGQIKQPVEVLSIRVEHKVTVAELIMLVGQYRQYCKYAAVTNGGVAMRAMASAVRLKRKTDKLYKRWWKYNTD